MHLGTLPLLQAILVIPSPCAEAKPACLADVSQVAGGLLLQPSANVFSNFAEESGAYDRGEEQTGNFTL